MHVHVIPTRSMADVAFANAADHVARQDLDAAADAIRARLRAAGRPEVAE
jgi:diadenosine tetraphosphate (Ap4A) HIT family hydrolase